LKLTLKQNFWEFNSWLSKNVFVYKEYAYTVTCTNYTQLHQLGALLTGPPNALDSTAFSLTKKRILLALLI